MFSLPNCHIVSPAARAFLHFFSCQNVQSLLQAYLGSHVHCDPFCIIAMLLYGILAFIEKYYQKKL